MVGLFVRLKLRLLAGNLRAGGMRATGIVLSVVAAAGVAAAGFVQLAVLRVGSSQASADRGIVTLTSLFLAWLVLPLLAFGQDETLDPATLALFPLRPRQLATGLVAAAATGPWPVATLVIGAGAVVGLAPDPAGVVLGLLAVPVFGGLCLVTSRLAATALSRMLRSRRGRDLLALVMGLLVVVSQLPNLLIQRGVSTDVDAVIHRSARLLRWSPPGMVAEAMADGATGRGVAALTGVALLTLTVARLWVALLGRMLVTADTSGTGTVHHAPRRRGPLGLLSRSSPDGPLAAVTAKELRYARRDPRRRVMWVSSLAFAGVMAFNFSRPSGFGSPAAVIGTVSFVAAILAGQAGNSLGLDGRFLWFNVLAYRGRRDLRTDFAGRHLAYVTIALPLLVGVAGAVAIVGGDLLVAVPAAVAASGVLGVGLGVNAVTSVLFPYAVPDRANAFSNAAAGQGCIAGLAGVLSLGLVFVLALPLVLPAILGPTWLCVLAPPAGFGIAAAGRAWAASIGYPRLPEILATVARSD